MKDNICDRHMILTIVGKGVMSTPASTSGSPVGTPRGQGPFPRASTRRGLVEKSPLIRHPSTVSSMSVTVTGDDTGSSSSSVSSENHQFLKDVIDQVLAGDGVGWLKLSKLKKLMEDDTYRMLILNKLITSLEPKVAPDDHIQDVVSYELKAY